MTDETRETWPSPPSGMQLEDLSFDRSMLLLHQKMDVLGRELYQLARQVESIATDLELTKNEVRRHGQCIAPCLPLDSGEVLGHD